MPGPELGDALVSGQGVAQAPGANKDTHKLTKEARSVEGRHTYSQLTLRRFLSL